MYSAEAFLDLFVPLGRELAERGHIRHKSQQLIFEDIKAIVNVPEAFPDVQLEESHRAHSVRTLSHTGGNVRPDVSVGERLTKKHRSQSGGKKSEPHELMNILFCPILETQRGAGILKHQFKTSGQFRPGLLNAIHSVLILKLVDRRLV